MLSVTLHLFSASVHASAGNRVLLEGKPCVCVYAYMCVCLCVGGG